MFVASAGGHLDELLLLAERRAEADDGIWVTSRSPQTESLLAGREVLWQEHVSSGQFGRALRGVPAAVALHRRVRPERVVSTGAAQAVPHVVAAAMQGTPFDFIESATRLQGPSKSGRLFARLPGGHLYTQHESWSDDRWQATPWVFDRFAARPVEGRRTRRIVVSLGSERFPFRRAIDAMDRVLPGSGVEVTWQTGSTESVGADGRREQWLPSDVLRRAMAAADVVITHAGVGSALAALSVGRIPVLLTRSAAHGEHVDDHQAEFARRLAAAGLAIATDPDSLEPLHLLRASRLQAVATADLPADLQPPARRDGSLQDADQAPATSLPAR